MPLPFAIVHRGLLARLILTGLVMGLASLVGCDGGDVSGRSGRPPAKLGADQATPGVTDAEIRIGSSLALTGHASYLGTQTLIGAGAYLSHVNAQGGVHGRTINLIAMDDGYDPSRCLVNTQKLLIEENVFALSCYVGTPTTLKIIPLVDKARIPLVGMFTGANALREPFNRSLINIRPSYYQETSAAVKHLVKDMGLKKIAVFYQYDAYGFDGLTGTELALKNYGLTPVARGNYARGGTDIGEALARIADSGAEAVVMIGTYEPCAKFINTAKSKGYRPVFYMVSFVGAEELARRLTEHDDPRVVMSQVVPPPDEPNASRLIWWSVDYARHLAERYPDQTPNVVGLEGYINARVLVEGLTRAGPNLTRDRFLSAIESISSLEIGEDASLSFGPADHQGLDKVYFTRLTQGRFRLFTDWPQLALPAPPTLPGAPEKQ